MKAIFSQACDFGSLAGHGRLALATAKPFFEKGFLKRFICFSHSADLDGLVKDVPLGFVQKNAIRALGRLGLMQQGYLLFDNSFDLLASRMVSECDLFLGWHHHALYSMRKAKKLGAKALLESPTAHIQEHNAILKEEIKQLGLQQGGIIKPTIEKSLKEYGEADFIVVQSSFARDSFIKQGFPEEGLVVVPAGADASKFKAGEKKGGKFRLAFAGRVCFEKGVHYLLDAWQQLGLKDAELLLCGNISPESKQLFAKYRGNDSIKFLGHVDTAAVLRECDAFAMPSLQDGFCMAVAEAMSCSLPVIVSENTGAKDLVQEGKNGFVVPIKDAGALKEKIQFLYNSRSKCKSMGKAARQAALQYDLNARGQKLLNELGKRGLVE